MPRFQGRGIYKLEFTDISEISFNTPYLFELCVACVKAFSSSNANKVAVRHSVRVSLSIHKFLSYQMDTSGELLVMITRIGLERLLIQEMDCQQHASQFKGQQFKSSLV